MCRPVVYSEENSLHIPEAHGEVVENNKPCTQKHAQKNHSFPRLERKICFEIAEVMLISLEKKRE